MKNTNFILLAALTAAFVVSSTGASQAQSALVSYDFTVSNFLPYIPPYLNSPTNGNLAYTSDQAATSVASGVNASDVSAPQGTEYGSGLTYSNGGILYDALTAYSGSSATSLASAISQNDYYTFTVSPSAGNILNLSSITVQVGTFNSNGDLSSYQASVEASPTGFSSSTALGSGSFGFIDNAYHVNALDYQPFSVDLTSGNQAAGSSFQGLTGPTEFRIYVPENAYDTIGLQSITLDGAVVAPPSGLAGAPVPEPSQYGMFVFLAAAALMVSKRFSARTAVAQVA